MRKNQNKDIAALVKAARKGGWRVVEKRAGVQLLSPDGENIVTLHNTPSDGQRAVKNLRAELRGAGLELP